METEIIKKINKTFDYHIHIGQYNDIYYEPHIIIENLYKNNIKACYFSSTTSCINWKNDDEKIYLLQHIKDEINEALFTADKWKFDARPLYWIRINYFKELKTNIYDKINLLFSEIQYKGFKIHTRIDDWNLKEEFNKELFENICMYANNYNLPIFIHTGLDNKEDPDKFEEWFRKYNKVKFILCHMKPMEKVKNFLLQYDNVYGDSSFVDEKLINDLHKENKIFQNKILYGTDYPINNIYRS